MVFQHQHISPRRRRSCSQETESRWPKMHIWFLTLGKLASNWFPSPLVRTHLPLPQPRRKGELFTSDFYGSCWVLFFLGKSKGGLSLLGFTMSPQSFSNGTIYIHDHWNLVSMRTLIQEFWGGAWDCAFPNQRPVDTVAGPETTLWALRSHPRFSDRRIELSLRMLSLNETTGQIPSSRMAEMDSGRACGKLIRPWVIN